MTLLEPTSDAQLRSDIREMGRILGDVIKTQWGEDFYELVEEVRTTARSLRETPDPARLEWLMTRLERASLWEIERLVRCFTLYFHLANTAEQHHRISAESIAPQHETETVVRRALEDGMTLEEL